ncbi:MAG: ATP-dependent helicase [Thermodesulfobacteriota bacterium]
MRFFQARPFFMDFSSLTSSQAQAVRYTGGPLIVLAGPGTGKTRTLTFRIAHLIESGLAAPDRILAVTFTNQAAEEMRSRLEQSPLGNRGLPGPWISTFHGFCLRFLKENLSSPRQLLSEQESIDLLKETVQEQFPDFPKRQIKELARRISLAKNSLIPPGSSGFPGGWEDCPSWPSCYRAYQEQLSLRHLWDFDELILQTVYLLEENPLLQTKVHIGFPFVLVDEFQDINTAQYRLFQLISQKTGSWMVIGDPCQAIYGFRGARADFFLYLQQDYPQAKMVTLQDTFRLNRTVLEASNQVLKDADGRPSAQTEGPPFIPVVGLSSAEAEGEYIAGFIEKEMGGLGLSSGIQEQSSAEGTGPQPGFADFAVLYRLHAQGEIIAGCLSRRGIPFKKIQEIHWVERPEIRTCLEHLKSYQDLRLTPVIALERVVKDFPSLFSSSPEGSKVLHRLRLEAASFKGTFDDFLENLSLQTGLDTYEPDQETVKLLTLHAAKGLEFPVVLIAGCEDNLLPLTLLGLSDKEEERRLFYVGLTRAKEKVILTWTRKRTFFGQTREQNLSPFVGDIDDTLKTSLFFRGDGSRNRPRKKQMDLFSH